MTPVVLIVGGLLMLAGAEYLRQNKDDPAAQRSARFIPTRTSSAAGLLSTATVLAALGVFCFLAGIAALLTGQQ